MAAQDLSRRGVVAGLVLVVTAPALATTLPPDAEAEQKRLIGDAIPQDGGVILRLPETAENGAQVPVTVGVEAAQTVERHVTAIHLIATRNPTPGIATLRFTPASGRAQATTRIRLAEGQTVVALAVWNDGTVRRATATVQVAVGGCIT
ncbi:MAG: sulfur oxidation protein SoxY [Alphaproteobacteria bacterium]|nr:thiosulfate oxidation carrier protein SoxY [Alphaproteobacteria bacterium]TAD90859.1 MAG: sulfur oxidation protein SoxY [Alphaproteobacteria bacterium]